MHLEHLSAVLRLRGWGIRGSFPECRAKEIPARPCSGQPKSPDLTLNLLKGSARRLGKKAVSVKALERHGSSGQIASRR